MKFHRKIFFLLIALLPTQLGYHLWPSWTMVLGRRIDYLSPTLYVTDILVMGTLLFWCIDSWRVINFRHIFQTKHLFFLGYILVNLWFATNRPIAVYAWIKFFEFIFLGVYMIRSNIPVTFMFAPLSIGVVYASLIAIAQFWLQHSVGGVFWFLGERTIYIDTPGIAHMTICNPLSLSCVLQLRSYGTFPHPNVLGGYLAVTIPLLIGQIRRIRPIRPIGKKILWVSIALGLVALVCTFSRSAWVVCAIGIGAVFVCQRWERQRRWSTPTIKFSILLFLIIVLGFIWVPIQSDSIVIRQQLNVAAIEMWRRAPLVGVGLGNFIPGLVHVRTNMGAYTLQPAHNIYLLVLAETGVVGFAFCVYVLWMSIRRVVLNMWRRTNVRKSHLDILYFLPYISVLLLGLVDHYPLTLQQGQLLFVLSFAFGYTQSRHA